MKRRRLLARCGAAGCLPALWFIQRPPRRSIEIRYWLSQRGAAYDVHERIPEYVTTALFPIFETVNVSFGGVVDVQTEHGYDVTASGEWPRLVAEGHLRSTAVDPVRDVNLLLTDGSMRHAPTGVAAYHLASVGGARHLEGVPPRERVDDVVPYERALLVMQILIHEIGHVLGLAHDHGSIERIDGAIVASPMVSSYAWMDDTDQFDGVECACGTVYPDTSEGDRYLSFVFSDCAMEKLRAYRGGIRR